MSFYGMTTLKFWAADRSRTPFDVETKKNSSSTLNGGCSLVIMVRGALLQRDIDPDFPPVYAKTYARTQMGEAINKGIMRVPGWV